ncbi:hypothetical protein BDV93DRAFT_552824 [Ceratobasidium sp. AG-I]|nr:hypothetical protein BDV93DRAFT_552824 [Ceratobasidium sp. AG-I]
MVQSYAPLEPKLDLDLYLVKVGTVLGEGNISLDEALAELADVLASLIGVALTEHDCKGVNDAYACQYRQLDTQNWIQTRSTSPELAASNKRPKQPWHDLTSRVGDVILEPFVQITRQLVAEYAEGLDAIKHNRLSTAISQRLRLEANPSG